MSTISCTISGVSVEVLNNSFTLTDPLEQDTVLTLTVIDSTGTADFTRGQPVTFTDTVPGISYVGYVNSSAPVKPGLVAALVEHFVTCMGTRYRLNKRTNSKNYLEWYSGDVVTDFIDTTLAAEGVTAPYATHRDSTAADFNTGILSGTAGYTPITTPTSDGELELLKAGSDLTITENTTANFATGALTNVQATSNLLTPTTVSACKFQSTLSVPLVADSMYVKIWQGAFTVGSSDTLNYDLWISSTSPQIALAVDLTFSDGTFLHSVATIVDQNALAALPTTDLSSYAKDAWYTRNITLTGLTGKVINAVTIACAGTTAGTYLGYIKNCYLGSQSGSPFFSTSATTTNVNPPLAVSYGGFSVALTSVVVVQAWIPGSSYRISTGYSIDTVKLLKSSVLTWIGAAGTNAVVALYASYDGGNTYAACANNAVLPALPAGSNIAGLTLTLKEAFTNSGPVDLTQLPSLLSMIATLNSAPAATKSDIVTSYYNATTFNTGTYSSLGMAADAVGVTLVAPLTRNWNDLIITGQSLFPNYTNVTESASTGAYAMTVPGTVASPIPQGQSRLDFAGSLTNFTLEVDLKFNLTTAGNQLGVTYRQTYWDNANNTFGYYFGLANGEPSSQNLIFGYGSNSSSPAFTQLATASFTPSANTTYHVKIVVSGNSHQIYFNGAGSPTISVTDSTILTAGYIGLRYFGATTATTYTYTFDNFALDTTIATSGTWISPAVSLSSLGTCGPSAIAWTESNTAGDAAAIVQTSIDGGGTYQLCVNGGSITSLTAGSNVSGVSLLTKITLTTTPGGELPEVARLVWRVLGVYSGSTGTRSTIPLGNDTFVRANQSGAGTALDGQGYVKVGTGTDAIVSDALTISSTTGDVHEILGNRTGTDLDGTLEFSLDASSDNAGMELRYVDTNNFYRIQITTTTLSIVKKLSGVATTLATTSITLSVNTPYWTRFRVVGANPATLTGRVWASGVLEPTTWQATALG